MEAQWRISDGVLRERMLRERKEGRTCTAMSSHRVGISLNHPQLRLVGSWFEPVSQHRKSEKIVGSAGSK